MIKCIVWDLDNTIWNGNLVDEPILLNETALQLIQEADSLGIMQSIASRNESGLVLDTLKTLGIRDYFLYPQCNFDPKTKNLEKIAKHLNIGLDSIVFVDDSPYEIHEVNHFLPTVQTVFASEENWLVTLRALIQSAPSVTGNTRRHQMAIREKREEALESFGGTREEFLQTCEMTLQIRNAQEDDLPRVYELTRRTNKLNNLTKRLSLNAVYEYFRHFTKQIYVCELTDIFGNHGIVGVCFFDLTNQIGTLELFCISCRIEGYGIGSAFLGTLLRTIRFSKIRCGYRKTENNRAALLLLKILGFCCIDKQEQISTYEWNKMTQFDNWGWLRIVSTLTEENDYGQTTYIS